MSIWGYSDPGIRFRDKPLPSDSEILKKHGAKTLKQADRYESDQYRYIRKKRKEIEALEKKAVAIRDEIRELYYRKHVLNRRTKIIRRYKVLLKSLQGRFRG